MSASHANIDIISIMGSFTEKFWQYLRDVKLSLRLSVWEKEKCLSLDTPLAANIGIKRGKNCAICHR